MKRRTVPTPRSPAEADAVVLGRHDVTLPGEKGVTTQKRTGKRVVRKTIWLPQELAEQLGVHAVVSRATEASVVELALRKHLGRE